MIDKKTDKGNLVVCQKCVHRCINAEGLRDCKVEDPGLFELTPEYVACMEVNAPSRLWVDDDGIHHIYVPLQMTDVLVGDKE